MDLHPVDLLPITHCPTLPLCNQGRDLPGETALARPHFLGVGAVLGLWGVALVSPSGSGSPTPYLLQSLQY